MPNLLDPRSGDQIDAPVGSGWRATLRRSVRLFSDFRVEQTDPARFYTALAADSVGQLAHYTDGETLQGTVLLDVGGGPGYFRDAFMRAGATYLALDADAGEMQGAGIVAEGSMLGDGMRLPFRTGSVDACYSSNVLEHVPTPTAMLDEMLRVTRPGGVVFCSYTLWWGPGAATRPARGTCSAAGTRAAATCASTGTSPRTSSASRCTQRPPPPGCAGRAPSAGRATPRSWLRFRATTRRGRRG